MAFPGPAMTVLRLSGVGVPPYSARGLNQTLTPIAGAQQLQRTINGVLRDFGQPQFRKYRSTITGDDQQPPACDGVWPGQAVTVDCIYELAKVGTADLPTETESEYSSELVGLLDRPPVPGSIRNESGFIFYRPRLEMRVTNFTANRREWAASVGWSMELEEI